MGLDTAPVELGDGWGEYANDARAVIELVRQVCLEGVPLVSGLQPEKIRIDERRSGPPHIWLHKENPETAWIVLDFAPLHWIQLAYQLGHELGHVLCNSWQWDATRTGESQWLEEAMVEAFSLRGLARLADAWEKVPPFAHDEDFAAQIRKYRDNATERYRSQNGDKCSVPNITTWYRCARTTLEHSGGVGPEEGPAILAILAEYDKDGASLADLGALNRWPERTALPLEQYLSRWQSSCSERAAPGNLPRHLAGLFSRATE